MDIPNKQHDFGGSRNDRALRRLLTGSIRRSPKKRAQIAEELSAMLGMRITENMLNDFTSDCKKGVRFPLLFCATLCEILDDDSIGLFGVRPRIRMLVEYAERELAGFRDQREREAMREQLLREEYGKHEAARDVKSRHPSENQDR